MIIRVDYKALGARIRESRRQAGYSQEKLADIVDLHPKYIGQIERAERTPSLETCISLCYALQMSLNTLCQESLPEDMFGECSDTLRRSGITLRNTLSNWVLTDKPDESLTEDLPVDLHKLPPLDFMALDEDFPSRYPRS